MSSQNKKKHKSYSSSRRKFLASSAAALTAGSVSVAADEKKGKYEDQNGIYVYTERYPDLPAGAPPTFECLSRFGYKLVEMTAGNDKKKRLYWMVGDESDYRKTEGQRLKIKPEDVKIRAKDCCYMINPNKCDGNCGAECFCKTAWNPKEQHYCCVCVSK